MSETVMATATCNFITSRSSKKVIVTMPIPGNTRGALRTLWNLFANIDIAVFDRFLMPLNWLLCPITKESD